MKAFSRYLLPALLLPGCVLLTPGSQSRERADLPSQQAAARAPRTLADLELQARRHHAVLEVPRFESSPADLEKHVREVLAAADKRLDALAAQDPERVTFASTIAALDSIRYPVTNTANRVYLIKETSPDPAVRKAATDQVEKLERWGVGVQYREDVYKACRAFADAYEAGKQGRLAGEDHKLYHDTMRDYRRAGLELDEATRKKVEALQNHLNELATQFDTNITNASVTLIFKPAELEGVPEAFLDASKRPDGTHAVRPTVITDYLAVMQNARSEATRKRLKIARYSIAMKENGPILDQLLTVRDEIADLLGYASWDDYQIEPRMAKNAGNATRFVENLSKGLEPKFRAELETMRRMKARDTGNPDAQMKIWDFRYYMNQIQKENYSVDAEALRVFFPLKQVLDGMFGVYETIFGLKIEPVQAPEVWADGVTLHVVSDAATGEPLGLFYLDLFPREGKYNHFAQFGVVDEKVLPDGRSHRPVAALVGNFTPPGEGRPSLLAHSEVETLFHEFGHVLHTLLTRTKYATFAGTNVPRDFVEAPSQMLENWVWDPKVLERFAADYRDPAHKIDPKTIARMKEADLATKGTFYRRQLCFALADLRMHAAGHPKDAAAIANKTMAEIFMAPPEGTNFAAYWGHLTGYDAGYYGYSWSDAIASDLATAFRKAPGGFLDRKTGMRLRHEIYEVGGSRDVEESIRRFLGRERSNQAFLADLGIR